MNHPEEVKAIMEREFELEQALKFDALDVAEKLTGMDYKELDATMGLGLGLFFRNNAKKAELLKASDDTGFHSKLPDYQRIIQSEGFVKVLEVPVPDKDRSDTYFLYWNPEGLLLSFDTYGDAVNGGNIYYNWAANDGRADWQMMSGGSWHKRGDGYVMVGSRDCREAVRFHLARLRSNGKFLASWVERPFLWLLHYADSRVQGYDYKAINDSRIAMLPQEIQDAIKGEVR